MDAQMKIDGAVIRALREEKSWSQAHLAAASGLSERTIQRVESDGVASPETRLALAAALDVPVTVLTAGLSPAPASTREPWRVPLWGWLSWAVVTVSSIGLIAFVSSADGTPLRQMALNLFPWLAMLGICLAAVSIIGAMRRSRPGAPRQS